MYIFACTFSTRKSTFVSDSVQRKQTLSDTDVTSKHYRYFLPITRGSRKKEKNILQQ